MIREVKFRFWSPQNQMNVEHSGWMEGIGINEALACSRKYGYEIMQWTGMKDKNAKDIYEGDILAPMSEANGPMQVHFKDGCFVATNRFNVWGPLYKLFEQRITDKYAAEIIGNIYETPEFINHQPLT